MNSQSNKDLASQVGCQAMSGTFFVVGSDAVRGFGWDRLKLSVSDPFGSKVLDPSFQWQQCGFPTTIKPPVVFDGPFGGGLVFSPANPLERWLPSMVISRLGNIRQFDSMRTFSPAAFTNVFYVEPHDIQLSNHNIHVRVARIPAVIAISEKTDDHAVYWGIGEKTLSRTVVEEIAICSEAFGLPGFSRIERETPLFAKKPKQKWSGPESWEWFLNPGLSKNLDFVFAVFSYFCLEIGILRNDVGTHGIMISSPTSD